MKDKICLILFLIFFIGLVGAGLNIQKDLVFKGINKHNVFTELVSNKADIASGEAIFKIDNPFKELNLEKTLFFDWYIANGKNYNSYEFYVGEVVEESNPVYEDYQEYYDCYYKPNFTDKLIKDNCSRMIKNQTGVAKVSHFIWTKNKVIDKGQYMIKFVATWDAHLGPQDTDWFPEMNFNKDDFKLFKDIRFQKSEWAWFNNSWEYYKEYTNLTGNITYMEINKTGHDNSAFTDTRFLSCYNDSLVFNHTIESMFGESFGLAYNSSISPYNNGNLVSYYKFDNNDFSDAHGSNDGTNSGTTNTSGKILDARDFDGASNYIDTDITQNLQTFSAMAWINSDLLSGSKNIIAKDTNAVRGWVLRTLGDKLSTEGNGAGIATGTTTLSTGSWYQVVITSDGSTVKSYLNGVEETSTSFSINSNTNADISFGRRNYIGAEEYFDGKIDEVSIFNSSLTVTEVQELYNATKGQFRLNNNGENCSLRYYGNSEAETTSSASDVYYEPVSAYYLDSNANDFVGSNHGTNNGATLTTGYINGSYDFDGGSNYIDLGFKPTVTEGFSANIWIRTTGSQTDADIISQWGAGGSGYASWDMHIDNTASNEVEFRTYDGSSGYTIQSSAFTNNVWHMLTLVFDGVGGSGTLHAYLDNVEIGSGISANIQTSTQYNVNLGRAPTNLDFFDGKIDEVLIYDKALTQDQITQLYTQTAPNFIEGNETSQSPEDLPPVINLNSPIENYNSTSSLIEFNGTAYDDINLINVTLSIDEIVNETNSSGINNSNYIFTKYLSEGSHNWSYTACDNSSQCTTETRDLFIDTIIPQISYTTGTEDNDTTFSRDWIFVNVSVNETNFENVSFELWNGSLYNQTIYTNLADFYNVNWTDLAVDTIYYYNVTVCDILGSCNSTNTRKITLIGPVQNVTTNLNFPEDEYDSYSNNITFNCEANSTGNLENMSLVFWNGAAWIENVSIDLTNKTFSSDYEIFIYADSVTGGTADVVIEEVIDGIFKITGTDGDYEVDRALVMKWLFYGSNGADPRATSTYITNPTYVLSEDSRDNNKRGIYAYNKLGTIDDASATINLNIDFNNTNNNYNVSSWSSVTSSLTTTNSKWFLNGSELNAGSSELGVDTSADELDNPLDATLRVYRAGGNSRSGSSEVIILSNDSVNWSVDGSSALHTYNLTDFYINESFPLFSNIDYYNFTTSAIVAEGNTTWSCIAADQGNTYFNINDTGNRTVSYNPYTPYIIYGSENKQNNTYINQNFIYIDIDLLNSTDFNNVTYFVYNTSLYSNITGDNFINQSYNFTNLSDDTYYYNVTTYNLYNYSNSTETRIITLDTTNPLIDYTANSDGTNITGNFNDKDWIFVNVSVEEINEANITFRLWNSTESLNISTFTDETRIINWTALPESMYFWNVTVCDFANNCNTTETRNYGVENTNLSLESNFSNIFAELRSGILVNATNNLNYVCVDVDHPDYGINYSCSLYKTGFELIINYFRSKIFNDSSTSKILNYTGSSIQEVFFPAHQYDEVDNMSINITGINTTTYPYTIQINKTNQSVVDRIFPGFLIGSYIYLSTLNDGLPNATLFFSSLAPQSIDFFMDDGAKFNELIFNITGIEFGFEYEDEFNDSSVLDPILNEGMFRGGFALPKGENLTSFVYDTFLPAGTINSTFWTAYPNGNYGFTYEWDINNNYNGGLILDTYMEANPGTDTTRFVENYAYGNYTKLNIWTAQEISFTINHANTATRDNSLRSCYIYPRAYLGGVKFWEAPWELCDDEPGDCDMGSETLEELQFNLTRNVNNSWNGVILGSERTYGDDLDPCGSYSFIYNYTNNSLTKTYTSCTDTVEDLNNTFLIEDPNWNTVGQINFSTYFHGSYDDTDGDGCQDMDSLFNISNLNHSLYNLTNSSIISNSVFDSSGDITDATSSLSFYAGQSGNDLIYPLLSANGGDNWENISDGVEHSFTYPGTSMKYRYDFFVGGGYTTDTPFILWMNLSTPKGYPTNLTFDFGNDGIIDATYSGELNISNSPATININSADLSSSFSSFTPFDHLYEIPLSVSSDSVGELRLDEFNLTYNPNPIFLNTTSLYTFLDNSENFTAFPISIESTGGNITVNDIRYDYAGGNSTINILAHNTNYTQNVSRNITYYYSRWDYQWGPKNVEWIYFAPSKPTSVNITPYGQASTVPILNITNYGYGGKNATLSIYQNGTNSCVNTTLSLTNDKDDGVIINESWIELTNLSYLDTTDIYLWADYNCNYSTWNLFEPNYYFRQCVEGGVCSTDII